MPLSISSPFLSSSLFTNNKTPLNISSFKPPPSSSSSTLRIRAEAATLPILSFTGDNVGSTTLSLKSAPSSTARAVVHRAIITDQNNARRGTASTLTRAEVRGGGRKPLRQKGSGRARMGSTRTPLRPGGGVIFGPKPKDWSVKINRKEKKLAISTALASAAASQAALVVEEFGGEFEKPGTRAFVEMMRRWGLDPKEKAMFLMMSVPENVRLSGRNVGTVKMLTPRTLNLFDVLDAERLVFTKEAVEYLNSRYGEKGEGEEGEDDEEEESVEG